jgi:hypothetical protein
MRSRVVGALVAVTIVLGALAYPSAGPVQARPACTGWTSSLRPPTSIRVLRTATQRTVTVPFRTYVERVMAAEWGPTHPPAALRIGAIAAKQYAWFFTMFWRGGRDAHGRCYDVVDTARDQVYDPSRRVAASHRAAVAGTWHVTLRRRDRLFMTGYRPGTGSCLANIDGWRLFQRDASDCVRRHGDTAEQLARRFFGPVSWVAPGAGDVTGDGRGDVLVASTEPETGALSVSVLTVDAAFRDAAAAAIADGEPLAITLPGQLLGRSTGDVNGDLRRDLVQLVTTEEGVALEVMLATATGLTPATTWWSSATDPAPPGEGELRLVVGDFTGEGFYDAAIVRIVPGETPSPGDVPGETPSPGDVPGETPSPGGEVPSTQVFLAPSTGSAFSPLLPTWTVAEDLSTSELHAGDVNGDGLADLIAVTPTLDGGTELRVALSTNARVLDSMTTWGSVPLPPSSLRALIGDVDRDGRTDIILILGTADGMEIMALRSPASGSAFMPQSMTGPLALPFETTRFSTSDLNRDGRADLVALVDRGTDVDGNDLGTQVWRLLSNSTATLDLHPWSVGLSLDWEMSSLH